MTIKLIVVILVLSCVLAACSEQDGTEKNRAQSQLDTQIAKPILNRSSVPNRQEDFNFSTVVFGGKVYQDNCASCHGVRAEGNINWRKRKPDGKLLPPPLNGSGHTWHHPKKLLLSIISNGTQRQGGDMPAWGSKLSVDEIEAVLLWVQSKWPEKTYTDWLEINKR